MCVVIRREMAANVLNDPTSFHHQRTLLTMYTIYFNFPLQAAVALLSMWSDGILCWYQEKTRPRSVTNDTRYLGSLKPISYLIQHTRMQIFTWMTKNTPNNPTCARDHWAVVLLCSHLARRWAALDCRSAWLVVDTQVKVCSRESHSPIRASKIYRHNAFLITCIHATVINSGHATQLTTAHTVGLRCGASALTGATVLADATVTPPSPKWLKMCRVGR